MTSPSPARTGAFALVLAALAFLLAACDGGVSGPTNVQDPDRITIQPDTAVLYSGMESTFTVSGGTGTYSITSSNQAVVQVPTFLNGRTFTITPANVLADTPITITVRDSGTAPVVSASLTVRPGTVANNISVIPTETQGGSCSPAVCSGGDAVLFATISQGGNPLPARGVRLDVVSGDFRFITSPPNQPEVLSTQATVVTDQAGGVHARIRVLPGATNQTGIVQVTDLGTNAFRRAIFSIAQATGSSPGFFTVPESFTFTGPNDQQCAAGTRADVSIFGGSPPYTISNAGSSFGVSQNVVTQSGGSFYVVANGACADNVPISVVDAAGRTAVVSVSNVLGTLAIPDLVASPDQVTISECGGTATISVAGGIPGNFTASSGSPAINVSPNPSSRLVNVTRATNRPASSPVFVGIASGDKSAQVEVILTGDALNTNCDGSSLRVTPPALTLSSCGPVNIAVTGGNPPYTVRSNDPAVTVDVCNVPAPNTCIVGASGSTTGIRRTPGSGSGFQSGTLTVTDGGGSGVSRTVPISGVGAGSQACP